MKKISLFILTILTILGFTSNVEAYSYSSITANRSGDKYEYVSGLPIYYNTANGYNIYVLNSDTYFDTYTSLTDPVEVNDGFSYIINNNNVTSSSYRNYYIAQVAVLWYQDYLNGNDTNIPSNIKNDIINNAIGDTVKTNINKLVNKAKSYSNNEAIKFIDKNVTFTRNDNYYYSNVINVETYNLRSTPSVRLYNAPTNATIVNNTVVSNGTGSFQIRIPSTSFNSITEKDFELYITGSTNNTKLYKYTNYGSTPVIYSRSISSNYENVEASIPIHISGIDRTNVRIHILNRDEEYLRNLKYYIYSGDCTKSTCYTDNLITSFTTNNNYISLNNTLNAGTYTLVNKSSNNNYNLPNKTKFTIENFTSVQDVTVKEGMDYDDDILNDSSRKINIVNKLNDYNNEIKIYTTSNYLQTSYRSSETNKSIYLTEGTYYIVDSKNKLDKLYFKITSDGRLQVKYNNDYVFADYITLDRNDYNDSLTDKDEVIYDENSDTYYVDGVDEIIVEQNVNTEVEWLSNIIDCPITSLNETIKYVVGACIIALGSYFLIKNVKRTKNNN